jgi:hypothetical protein
MALAVAAKQGKRAMKNSFDQHGLQLSAKRGRRRFAICLFIGTSLSACTTSLTVREDTATLSNAAPGIAYRLPEKKLSLEVTWTVSNCPIVTGSNAATQDIGFETSAALVSTIVEVHRWSSTTRA